MEPSSYPPKPGYGPTPPSAPPPGFIHQQSDVTINQPGYQQYPYQQQPYAPHPYPGQHQYPPQHQPLLQPYTGAPGPAPHDACSPHYNYGGYQSGAPPGYPQPGAVPGYQPLPPCSATAQPKPSVVIVGGCPACRVGVLEDDFTCLGVCCAIFLFPIGILCCLAMRQRRCPNCGANFS